MSERDIDEQLVLRAQQGDQRAFSLLVEKYQRKLARLLSRLVRDSHELEDVCQETFIKAYRALGSFRGESAFYTWLYRIGINTAKNYLMSKNKRAAISMQAYSGEGDEDMPAMEAQIPDYHTPEEELMNRQIIVAVNQVVNKLPEELRTAITLREMEGLSYEDIAEAMNCPIGTVRSRIFRAREAISLELKPLLEVNKNKRW
jgi:RNA polymerase sigma-70 factor (ECF subfamily)